MSSTGTSRNRSRGMPSSSRNRSSKKTTVAKKNSSCTGEKISKFFAKVAKKEAEESDLSDSPYRTHLSDVKGAINNSENDLDDFKTPQAINKVSKIDNTKRGAKKCKKTILRQPRLQKFIKDNLQHSDVSPDHLQMALALSESSYEAEHGRVSSDEKIDSFRKALEHYGFGCSKNKVPVEHRRSQPDIKKNKKSRYRYVTPTLKIRTVEDREALISSKVSLILAQNSSKPVPETSPGFHLLSESLNQYVASKTFEMNQLESSELRRDLFYVPGLDLEVCSAPCGHLLREWGRIPGREPTPERTISASGVASPKNSEESPKLGFDCGGSPSVGGESGYKSLDISSLKLTPAAAVTNKNLEMCSPNWTTFVSPKMSPAVSVVCLTVDLTDEDEDFFCKKDADRENALLSPNFKALLSPQCRRSPQGSSTCLVEENPGPAEEVEDFRDSNTVDLTDEDKTPLSPLGRGGSPKIKSNSFGSNQSLSPQSRSPEDPTEGKSPYSHGLKRPRECISPDLFGSDDDCPLPMNRLRGGSTNFQEPEDYDLSQENTIEEPSDLNVTDYVHNLLTCKQSLSPPRKLEKVSTSDEESQKSQESICISDDELNYSSVFSSSPKKKVEYDLSDDDSFEAPLLERIKTKSLTDVVETHQRLPLSTLPSTATPNKSENGDLLIKTTNVTPMANYDEMDTPKISKELDKFGLKPLKRQKGAKLLKYLYESTHPLVETENSRIVKKRRGTRLFKEGLVADVAEEDSLIFERSQSKRIASCRVPLHIVWHNFVMSNPTIMEDILLYEPLQLEVVHSRLKELGFKFHVQDLLAFLDKKCITIRTAQGRGKRC